MPYFALPGQSGVVYFRDAQDRWTRISLISGTVEPCAPQPVGDMRSVSREVADAARQLRIQARGGTPFPIQVGRQTIGVRLGELRLAVDEAARRWRALSLAEAARRLIDLGLEADAGGSVDGDRLQLIEQTMQRRGIRTRSEAVRQLIAAGWESLTRQSRR